MADYIPYKICNAIDDINSGKLILPAMQRDFVWPENKVCDLFDSILKDYPIGTFLFWDVNKDTVENYAFNEFLHDFDEQNNGLQRGKKIENPQREEFFGVLDGQQRITSIYIGICGKYRIKKANCRRDYANSYVDKYLCLDILYSPNDSDSNYHFKFMDENKTNKVLEDGSVWVKVRDIYNKEFDATSFVEEIEANCNHTLPVAARKKARQMLTALHLAFFDKNHFCTVLLKNLIPRVESQF